MSPTSIPASEDAVALGSQFDTLADLQSWLDEALAGTPVTATALILQKLLSREDGFGVETAGPVSMDGMDVVGSSQSLVGTDIPPGEWYERYEELAEVAPRLGLAIDGDEIVGGSGDCLLRWDGDDGLVYAQAVPTTEADLEAQQTLSLRDAWVVIHIEETLFVLPFPADVSVIRIRRDEEQSAVLFAVGEASAID